MQCEKYFIPLFSFLISQIKLLFEKETYAYFFVQKFVLGW